MTQVKEDEIDILSIFNTLWEGRWKIIATTVTTTLLGLVYIFNLPNIFKVTTPIDNGKPTYFFKYTPINDVLKENKIGYNLTSNTVFEMFLDEFYDYKEMRFVLSQDEEVIKSIKNLDKEKQNKSLTKLAKSFEIIFNGKNYILSYEWNDVEKGSSLFNKAIYITLSNVKKTILNDINVLANSSELKRQRRLKTLELKLNSIKETNELTINRRIQYLTEHSNIAKELGIETSLQDTKTRVAPSNDSIVVPIITYNNKTESIPTKSQKDYNLSFPYYLRGFKAIDKEISLIKNRSKKQRDLMATDYIEIKNQISLLKQDTTAITLKNLANEIETSNTLNWIQFNLDLADVISKTKKKLLLILSIMLGGFVGIIYVFINKALVQRKIST